MAGLTKYFAELLGVKLVVPFYHIVSDAPVAHTRYLYPCKTVSQFKDDIVELLRHFNPVDISQVKRNIHGSQPFRKPCFILTFDDGLRQCYDHIAPVLLEMGVPAVFFVNTGFLDNADMLYRMKASILTDFVVQSKKKAIVRINGSKESEITPESLLSVTYPDRQVLETIAQQLGVDFKEYQRRYKPYMDFAQVQKLHQQGFAIGGHTHTHPDFRYLSYAEQVAEARQSIVWLKEKACTDSRLFSFPFTDYWTENRFFRELSCEIDLFFGSAGLKKDTFATNIQRINMEAGRHPKSFLLNELSKVAAKKMLNRYTSRRAYD